jgi:hypothetical protein
VLRPAVQQHDRVAGARLGDVHADAARLHEAVLDPREAGELAHG